MYARYLFLFIVAILCAFPIIGQTTVVEDSIVLDQPLSEDTYSYIGLKSVILKPGFSYKATVGNGFHAFIGTLMTYQYDASGNRIARTYPASSLRSAHVQEEKDMQQTSINQTPLPPDREKKNDSLKNNLR